MSTKWMRVALMGIILSIGAPVFGVAQPSQTTGDTYTWNGEFVSLDTTAQTLTVKFSRCVSGGDLGAEALQRRRPCMDCLVRNSRLQ